MDPITFNNIGLPVFGETDGYPYDCFFSNLGLFSLLFALVVVAVAVGLSYIVDKKFKWFEETANKYLTTAFIAVWIFGFMVYDIGMYTGNPWSLLGNVPMAIVHAFGIFILESDVSAIHEPFHNNWFFMAAFSMVHLLAAVVSLIFVLKYFGFSVIAAIRRKLIHSSKKDTYIFWGMNDATYYLARDINDNPDVTDYRIVIIRTNTDSSADSSRNGIDRLLNFLSLKSRDLERLKELDCITANTFTSLAAINPQTDNGAADDILGRALRLKSVRRIIGRYTTGAVHVFFLSDDADANIRAVSNLSKDRTIQEFARKGKVRLYCHARYNSVHRVIEDEQTNANIDVKVVDSSRISVEQLKDNRELQPVNYVKVESDATVSTPFNSLVVGFGEVGLDAVRFLYEFGAFVKTGSEAAGKVTRSEFRCRVVDRNMDDLAGLFVANAPSIRPSLKYKPDDDSADAPIELYKLDCGSVAFYENLASWVKDLNYVVVATGDDETNISLAVRIFRLAVRYRADLGNFRIMVRIKKDDNRHIFGIAQHYNRLWDAEQHRTGESGLNEDFVSATQPEDSPITLFGMAEDTYTYKYIVRDQLIESAKKYKAKYDQSIYENERKSDPNARMSKSWDEEEQELMQLADNKYKGFAPTYSGLMKLRRTQEQNIENSLHKGTKTELAEKALGREYPKLRELQRANMTVTYSWKDNGNAPTGKFQRVLDTLAETEHLRWNASHEILGYRPTNGKKDEARLLHDCLRPWEELSTEVKSYDYNVVDVALNII